MASCFTVRYRFKSIRKYTNRSKAIGSNCKYFEQSKLSRIEKKLASIQQIRTSNRVRAPRSVPYSTEISPPWPDDWRYMYFVDRADMVVQGNNDWLRSGNKHKVDKMKNEGTNKQTNQSLLARLGSMSTSSWATTNDNATRIVSGLGSATKLCILD